MKRTETDVKTGEKVELDLTPGEIAEFQARATEETAARQREPKSLEERVAALEALAGIK